MARKGTWMALLPPPGGCAHGDSREGRLVPEHCSPPTRQRLRRGLWGFSGAPDSCSDSLLDTRVHSSGGTGTRVRLVLGSLFPYCIPGLKY